ncbi:UNVERIFIED_CONTAM: protein VTE6, chloroplastic [Sesamum radiatum]|uniref:Protein VTE6, chloroplastic n=1 Tax=Sesamum radiatum TaxID=300843 RepID=A0AAW2KJH1_SESRA
MPTQIQASNRDLGPGLLQQAVQMVQSSPPTWHSALLSNAVIFLLGSPILVSGLSLSGIAAAFLLGTLTWRAFGPSGFLLVATYFVIGDEGFSIFNAFMLELKILLLCLDSCFSDLFMGTAVTKVKMAQKEAQGVAEKRKGRRGPGSVIGSSAAGCVCALLSIYGIGGEAFARLWGLGFVASFCTKLSDTVSSEIGKAYGKTTHNIQDSPQGTEGAVSVEGTLAGVLASILLASIGCLMGQIANLGESIIGAALQEKEGFQWLNNDVVNVINISMGSILAVLMQQLILQSWRT